MPTMMKLVAKWKPGVPKSPIPSQVMLKSFSLPKSTLKSPPVVRELSEANIWVKRVRECRDVIDELKGDLESCASTAILLISILTPDPTIARRVSDILRDKLYHFTSLLLESQEQVKDLQNEKAEHMQKLLTQVGHLEEQVNCTVALGMSVGVTPRCRWLTHSTDGKYEELLKLLATRERETIDTLAEAAKTEQLLKIANEE